MGVVNRHRYYLIRFAVAGSFGAIVLPLNENIFCTAKVGSKTTFVLFS